MPEISEEKLKELEAAAKERNDLKSEKDARDKADKEKSDKEKADKEKAEKEKKESESDLGEKVKKEKEAAEKSKAQTKVLEIALKFNMGLAEFVKNNSEVLPSEIGEIVQAAEKESYDSAPEKAAAVQTAVIKSFFSLQANLELLTPTQKTNLEDYLKLTKMGREEKAQSVYENIFEPALEMLKKLKKAEELGKANSGTVTGTKVEEGYKQRLMNASKKTYLGEKGDK